MGINNSLYDITNIMHRVEGPEMQSNGSNAPNVEGRVPSQLCHFGKRRAVGTKRDFPCVKQCRGRRVFGGAVNKPYCRPTKGEPYVV